MAYWDEAAITEAGIKMLNAMMAGHTPRLMRACGGTGVAEDIRAVNELVDTRQTLHLVDEQDGPEGKTVTVQISNSDLDEEYLLQQIGVFARADNAGESEEEKLLFVLQDKDGVRIPAISEGSFLLEIDCVLKIGRNGRLEVQIDPAGIVTIGRLKREMDREMEKITPLWGGGDPTAQTKGAVGQRYVNTDSGREFVCVAVSEGEGYTWKAAGVSTAEELEYNGQSLALALDTIKDVLEKKVPILGVGDPDETTQGYVGQQYTNTVSGDTFVCTSAGEEGCTWVMEGESALRAAIERHNGDAASHAALHAALAGLENRLNTLELKYGANVTGNPFTVSFGDLTGLVVTGVWNQAYARVEF